MHIQGGVAHCELHSNITSILSPLVGSWNRYSGNDQIKALLTLETPGQEDRNFSKNQNEWKGHVGGSYGRRLFII